jgi:zinc transport system substrate-binding protein
MEQMQKSIISILLAGIITLGGGSHAIAAERLTVFTSIAPQRYFVQQIGKDAVDVRVMVAPGADPHTYEPKPRQMAALSRAELYFAIGVPFENRWLRKIASTNSKMKVVHTDQGIDKIPITAPHHDKEGEHQMEDAHQHESEHASGGLDPHIWLSPPLVKMQAHTIMSALVKVDPAHQAKYEANYQKFVRQIDGLNNDLVDIFADKQGLRFMVFHPSWGYFARAYGLKQVPIEIEGKDPKPSQLKKLIEHAREDDIKVIFVQPQFSTRSAGLIAKEINGQVAFADPLAEDWLGNLREVADKFKAALK